MSFEKRTPTDFFSSNGDASGLPSKAGSVFGTNASNQSNKQATNKSFFPNNNDLSIFSVSSNGNEKENKPSEILKSHSKHDTYNTAMKKQAASTAAFSSQTTPTSFFSSNLPSSKAPSKTPAMPVETVKDEDHKESKENDTFEASPFLFPCQDPATTIGGKLFDQPTSKKTKDASGERKQDSEEAEDSKPAAKGGNKKTTPLATGVSNNKSATDEVPEPITSPEAGVFTSKRGTKEPNAFPYKNHTLAEIMEYFNEALSNDKEAYDIQASRLCRNETELRETEQSLIYMTSATQKIMVQQDDLMNTFEQIEGMQSELDSTLDALEYNVNQMFEFAAQAGKVPSDPDIFREELFQTVHSIGLESLEERLPHLAAAASSRVDVKYVDANIKELVQDVNANETKIVDLEVKSRFLHKAVTEVKSGMEAQGCFRG